MTEGNFPTILPIPDTLPKSDISVEEIEKIVKDVMRYRWLKTKGIDRQIKERSNISMLLSRRRRVEQLL